MIPLFKSWFDILLIYLVGKFISISSQYSLLTLCKRFFTLFEESGGSYLKLESREAFERFKDDDTGMFSFQLAWKLANDDCSVVVLEWLQGIGRKFFTLNTYAFGKKFHFSKTANENINLKRFFISV